MSLGRELASIDAIEQVEPSRGSKAAIWALTEMSGADVAGNRFDLPTVAQLEQHREAENERGWEGEFEADMECVGVAESDPFEDNDWPF